MSTIVSPSRAQLTRVLATYLRDGVYQGCWLFVSTDLGDLIGELHLANNRLLIGELVRIAHTKIGVAETVAFEAATLQLDYGDTLTFHAA
jgi:hypothetical protein